MQHDDIHDVLQQLADGRIDVAAAAAALGPVANGDPRTVGTADASIDVDRARRCGFPEVVFASGKTAAAVVSIFETLLEHHGTAFATRVSPEQAEQVRERWSDGVHNEVARTLRLGAVEPTPGATVTVVSAGTSDRPVAEEAVETARWMGCEVDLVVDVGVAGPQRLAEQMPRLLGRDAVVVVAGMEGALPSVVGGWLDCPVIAVPTSVGYGSHFGGMVPLLAMLNGCAANVTVVNVDAGFKGGYLAGLIATRAHRSTGESGS